MSNTLSTIDAPSIGEIAMAREKIADFVATTPIWQAQTMRLRELFGKGTELIFKLELLQRTGTFKPRGALLNVMALDNAAKARGIVAASAGNHAIAASYAAQQLGTTAKVVMPKSAIPMRVERCKYFGGQVVLVDDITEVFATMEQIAEEEGRSIIHPYEGVNVAKGTGGVGLEFYQQAGALDAVIIPIGGGGLCAGIACAIKQLMPQCQVFGVEPTGADSMHRSFAAGHPVSIDKVDTIADSLGAPRAEPYSFALCQHFVDELVMVDDDELLNGMQILFQEMKFAVEPAAAAGIAALMGPLKSRLSGKRIGIILCGTNIDIKTFARLTSSLS